MHQLIITKSKYVVYSNTPSGNFGKCQEMQELPGYSDQTGLQWPQVRQHGQQCEGAGQKSAGSSILCFFRQHKNNLYFYSLKSIRTSNSQEGKLEAEEFTEQLYQELKSTPQPCLVPFLKVKKKSRPEHFIVVLMKSFSFFQFFLEKSSCRASSDSRPSAVHPAGFNLHLELQLPGNQQRNSARPKETGTIQRCSVEWTVTVTLDWLSIIMTRCWCLTLLDTCVLRRLSNQLPKWFWNQGWPQ